MLPTDSNYSMANKGPLKSEGFRHSRIRHSGSAKLLHMKNQGFCHSSLWVIFAAWVFGSAFCYHVSRVIELSSNEEMIGIAASPIVAFMQDAQPAWNFPIGNPPSYPMGAMGLVLNPKISISSSEFACCPWPAHVLRSFIDLGPESFLQANSFLVPKLKCSFFSGLCIEWWHARIIKLNPGMCQ